MTRHADPLSRGLSPPDPPTELRRRTLIAARQAMERGEIPDVWNRVWNSRPAHLLWAASVAGLIFAHLVIPNPVSGRDPDVALPLAAAAGTDAELAEIAALPRLTARLPGFQVVSQDTDARPEENRESEDRS